MATTVGADREKKRNQEEFWRIVGRGNRPIRGDRCSAVTLDGESCSRHSPTTSRPERSPPSLTARATLLLPALAIVLSPITLRRIPDVPRCFAV